MTRDDKNIVFVGVMIAVPLVAWLQGCVRMLRPGGMLTLIHRADRLSDILAALGDAVDLRVSRNGRDAALRVRLDEAALLASQRRFGRLLRRAFEAGWAERFATSRFGLELKQSLRGDRADRSRLSTADFERPDMCRSPRAAQLGRCMRNGVTVELLQRL